MTSSLITTDVAIIGAGPAGLFAAFECAMLKIGTVLIDSLDEVGGQCTALYPEKFIYDIPAHPAIEAGSLIASLEKQIEPFSIPRLLGQSVDHVSGEKGDFTLKTSKGNRVRCKGVIIAAGAGAFGPNRPPLEHIEQFEQAGCVHYYIRNRNIFEGKRLVIAGGGDSAVDWALSLKDLAEHIYLVHRRPKFRAAPESLSRLDAAIEAGQVEKIVPYQLHALHGEQGQLHTVQVIDLDGNTRSLQADHLLPFFGLSTDLGPIAGWGLDIAHSRIAVHAPTCESSRPGVFAIGDVASYEGKLKLILQGFSEAAMAAHALHPLIYPDTALHFEFSTSKGVPLTS